MVPTPPDRAHAGLLTLVRHGETSANRGGVWHGSIDTPLTEHGLAQAKRVGEYLRRERGETAAIYCSPLQRARHTAGAIGAALGLEAKSEPELTEYHLGSWEGKTYAELMTTHKLFHHIKQDPDFAPHGGESPRQVADRYAATLRRIAIDHRGQHAVVVGHGGAFSMAFALLIEGDYTSWGGVMSNCGLSELTFDPDPKLLRFDLTDHLGGL
jgi:broad specificity phosphatase PhoE